MGGMSWIHWVILIAVVLVLFGGRGKISDLMGDLAKGIKSFKQGMAEDEDKPRSLPPENREESSNKDRTSVR